MTVAGIVSLPGMMTGQMLSGVSPSMPHLPDFDYVCVSAITVIKSC